jgi:hypothetical protein
MKNTQRNTLENCVDVGYPYLPDVETTTEGSSILSYAFQNDYDENFLLEGMTGTPCFSNCWCSSRISANVRVKASYYMWKWGLAYSMPVSNVNFNINENGSEVVPCNAFEEGMTKMPVNVPYNCGIFGGNSGTKLVHEKLDFATGAALLNCDDLQGAWTVADDREKEFLDYLGDMSGIAPNLTAQGKKHKANADVWGIIKNWIKGVIDYQDANEQSCYVDEVAEEWQAYNEEQERILNSMPKPMSNGTLALIVMGGALSMTLILTKFIK